MMKRRMAALLGAIAIAAVAHAADPVPAANTGDRKFDSMLGMINTEAKADPDVFVKKLSTMFSFPEDQIREVQTTHNLAPADLYMTAALAHSCQRPVMSVAEDYRKNEGKGWGAMAREMGIKPGSRRFHELKDGAKGSLSHMQANARAKHKHERQMMKERDEKSKHEPQGKGPGGNR